MGISAENFTYLILMVATIFFPFALSFEKRVAFYRKWPKLLVATAIPALLFIAWDAWFTGRGVWSFNDSYVLGLRFLGLPIEEWLFFFVIPYCSLFTYEVLKAYFPKANFNRQLIPLLAAAGVGFMVIAIVYYQQSYTFWNFTFNAIILGFLLLNGWFRQHLTHFVLTFAISLLPMLVVNGVLTAMPVVEYSPLHIIGIRVYTIPVEDFFYFLLLLMLNLLIYEWLQRRGSRKLTR